ncbi:hypothetical protein FSY45_14170 [Comamonas sp. Z1]|nr:hypothetical protein FSY45_14170 [Comamonas sp. Z1]
MTHRTKKTRHFNFCQLSDTTKSFKNQILIKNKESLIFLLQRNKLKLALPQILFHNAPMLHCNMRLTKIAVMSGQTFPPVRSLC